MFAYSSPVSFRAWDSPTSLQNGEVFFDHPPSAGEIAAAFPGFVAPAPAVALTFAQFVALFAATEQGAVFSSGDAQVSQFLLLRAAADAVNLADPATKAGLDHFASLGLLTSARETAILAGQAPA